MNYSTIKSTLELIKKQINLDLVLSENFNGKNYFNIDLKERVSESEEYDKLLIEDSNDRDKWLLKSVIGHKQNRLLSYPCNYFYSKYPNEFLESRKVFVMFYKTRK